MSIITKRKDLLAELDSIQKKDKLTKADRRQSHIILRRLCEKEVSIDIDEELMDLEKEFESN